jgi:hypothetical protein
MKKFVADRPFADPDAAARKIVEIANDTDAVQNGRIYIERGMTAAARGWNATNCENGQLVAGWT